MNGDGVVELGILMLVIICALFLLLEIMVGALWLLDWFVCRRWPDPLELDAQREAARLPMSGRTSGVCDDASRAG